MNNEGIGKGTGLEEHAYREIKMAILLGTYPPGFQISEELIAAQLEMSRSPVRNALRRLQADGFLEKHANRRMYVALVNPRRILDALYVRKALEGTAAFLAAQRRSEEDVARLREALEADKEALESGNPFTVYLHCIDIHRMIYVVAHNPQLERIGVNALEQEAAFSYNGLVRDHNRIRLSHEEHVQIVQAIIDRDAEEAERRARAHLEKQIRRINDASAEQSAPSTLLSRS